MSVPLILIASGLTPNQAAAVAGVSSYAYRANKKIGGMQRRLRRLTVTVTCPARSGMRSPGCGSPGLAVRAGRRALVPQPDPAIRAELRRNADPRTAAISQSGRIGWLASGRQAQAFEALGEYSAASAVLELLDRRHSPEQAAGGSSCLPV